MISVGLVMQLSFSPAKRGLLNATNKEIKYRKILRLLQAVNDPKKVADVCLRGIRGKTRK
jgi:hypothetical protein